MNHNDTPVSDPLTNETADTPSWSVALPTLLERLATGTPEQMRVARECLTQMAAVADLGIAAVASLIRISEPGMDIKQDADRIIAQAMQTGRTHEAHTVSTGWPDPGDEGPASHEAEGAGEPLQVCYCEAGFYIARLDAFGSVAARASVETWTRREIAQQALDTGAWTPRGTQAGGRHGEHG